MAKAKKPGTQVSTVRAEDIEKLLMRGAMAESAKALVAAEPVYANINIIRQKGGEFFLGDKQLKKPLSLVILTTAFGQFYYEHGYDPDNKEPPVCFALARTEGELVPSDVAPKKQFEGLCVKCPQNMKGSATGPNAGPYSRACSARRRIAVLMVDDLSDNPTIGSLEISPAGLREFSQYLQALANITKVHPAMVESIFSTKLSRNGDGSPYIVVSQGELMTRKRPEWFIGDSDIDINADFNAYFASTMLGRKVQEAVETKMLLSPPSLVAPTQGGKKPVTGSARVSVKDAKAKRKSKS